MTINNRTMQGLSSLAIGLQVGQPAIAHNGILHGQEQEATSVEPQPTAEPDPIDSSTYTSDSNPEVTAVESVSDNGNPTSLPVSSSNGFPIGWGEVLFGLILIFPWLLIAFRKQLHLQTRS